MAKRTTNLDKLVRYYRPLPFVGVDDIVYIYGPFIPGLRIEQGKNVWHHEEKDIFAELRQELHRFLEKHEMEPTPDFVNAATRLVFAANADPDRRRQIMQEVLRHIVEFLESAINTLTPLVESPLFCRLFDLRSETFVNLVAGFKDDLAHIEAHKRKGLIKRGKSMLLAPEVKSLSNILLLDYEMSKHLQAPFFFEMINSIETQGLSKDQEWPDADDFKSILRQTSRKPLYRSPLKRSPEWIETIMTAALLSGSVPSIPVGGNQGPKKSA